MNAQQQANLRTYLRVAPPPKVEPKLDLSNLTLEKLVSAAGEAFAKEQEKQPLGWSLLPPRVTIREKIDLISKTMKEVEHSTFRALLEQGASRLEIVVTFLAMLELVKRYRVACTPGRICSVTLRSTAWKNGRMMKRSRLNLSNEMQAYCLDQQ